MIRSKLTKRPAFTLIELLVVIAIIAILIALLRAIKESEKKLSSFSSHARNGAYVKPVGVL